MASICSQRKAETYEPIIIWYATCQCTFAAKATITAAVQATRTTEILTTSSQKHFILSFELSQILGQ